LPSYVCDSTKDHGFPSIRHHVRQNLSDGTLTGILN
uniref:Transposase n=1 Tax=Haemonchus placei TaxID=6290 RepID=A0A0N4VTG8_HAEPC